MKNIIHTFIVSGLLTIPAVVFSQSASNNLEGNEFNSLFSETKGQYIYPMNFCDAIINPSNFIKPNMLPAKLNGGVNSEYPEIGAIASPDGKTLYFSRYQDPKNVGGENDEEDIWYAEWDETNNTWGEAKNIGAPLNNKYPNFINSISPDGNSILLGNTYLSNGKMGPGFSVSNKTSQGWSFPAEIKITGIDKDSKWAGCHFSKDQQTLLLAYEQRKNTYGDRDIYVSFKKEDNSWTNPINLGNVVNTKGTESAPFLADDDSTLYFTSDGLPGYGGNDIYVTHRLDETWQNWSEPENLGPNINSDSHQSFFSIANGNIYYSSECKITGSLDIFTLNIPETEKTASATIDEPLAGENIEKTNSDCLTEGSLTGDVDLSFVFFDFDKSDLKKATIYELDHFTKILKENPSLQIELTGHTDNIGSKAYNKKLSQKRIDAILFYFKNQSEIDESRIIVKNLGETVPLGDNKTAEGRQFNRRVEMAVKTNLLANN